MQKAQMTVQTSKQKSRSLGACGGQAGTMLPEGQGAQTEVCGTQGKMLA